MLYGNYNENIIIVEKKKTSKRFFNQQVTNFMQ